VYLSVCDRLTGSFGCLRPYRLVGMQFAPEILSLIVDHYST